MTGTHTLPGWLRRVGLTLFGDHYHAQLAWALGVSLRTLQRWAAGTEPIPEGVHKDASTLLRRRREEIEALERGVTNREQDPTA